MKRIHRLIAAWHEPETRHGVGFVPKSVTVSSGWTSEAEMGEQIERVLMRLEQHRGRPLQFRTRA